MSRFIMKWRYIKSGTGKHSEQLVKYIATREGVEKCDESWKVEQATEEQERMIRKLITDFPAAKQSFEYRDYKDRKTKYTASEFINRTIEEHVDLIDKRENYVEYIAKRPRVEKQGTHGLFTQEECPVELSSVAKEVAEHKGVVWTTILSLRREDAERLGYNNAKAWKAFLRSETDNLAKGMGIPLTDLKWYAAFHNESHHPHVHLISYSKGKEPYMTEQGLKKLKSEFAREIFKQELYEKYEEQNAYREELREEGAEKLAEIVKQINEGEYENERVELLLKELSEILRRYKGKKIYGYLPKNAKNLVNGIVDELGKDKRLAQLYEHWYQLKDEIVKTYRNGKAERLPLSANEEFKPIRNAVIREAQRIEEATVERKETEINESITEPTFHELEKNTQGRKKTMWGLYSWGKTHLDQEGGEYEPKKAIDLLTESAVRGNTLAKYLLGKIFLRGEGTEQDIKYGILWMEGAVADGNEYAEYLLGKTLLNGAEENRDVEKAEKLLRSSVKKGNKYAAYTLGKALLEGKTIEKDAREGIEMLTKSAEKGFAPAQYVLGKMLYQGEETKKDTVKALKYLESAAKQRDINAAYLAGQILLSEEPVRAPEKAVRYFEAAAEMGSSYAEYQLGKIYLYGKYVPREEEKGIAYLTASAEHGNERAEQLLQELKIRKESTEKQTIKLGALRLFQDLSRIMIDRIESEGRIKIGWTDRKLYKQIAEKKLAQGIKPE